MGLTRDYGAFLETPKPQPAQFVSYQPIDASSLVSIVSAQCAESLLVRGYIALALGSLVGTVALERRFGAFSLR
jgi:hypothetical protein